MRLTQISPLELKLGTPLQFPLYSAAGKLLLAQGYRIQSEAQLDRLVREGAFRERASQSKGGQASSGASSVSGGLLISTTEYGATLPDTTEIMNAGLPALPRGPEAVQLIIEGHDNATFRAEFVGIVKRRTLLLTPLEESAPLQPGVNVETKLLWGRHVYLFSTRVAARSASPVDLLHLDYPESVKKHAIRTQLRVGSNIPGRLIRNDLATGFDATVVNVSLNGLGICLQDAAVELGEHFKLVLRITIEGKLHAVYVNCVARNMTRVKSGVMVGAELRGVSEEAKNALRNYIFQVATGTTF